MQLQNLKPAQGSTSKRKRVGRGQGSGHGGTSTRGHKGAKSRSGYSKKIGFEGGQMPLQRRVPKFGFKNPNRVEYAAINFYMIERIVKEKSITDFNFEVFLNNGLASKNDRIKILAGGELTSKVNIEAHAFSKTALEAIQAKGGEAKTI
ncbi:MAG: 50S ribosomal protein L15 [Luteibaculaceae bacterium]